MKPKLAKLGNALVIAFMGLLWGVFLIAFGIDNGWIERDEARIVPGTVSAQPNGLEYQITALTEAGGNRQPVYILATDCRYGHARNILAGSAGLETAAGHVLLNGDRPEDRMFTQLCNEGMPLVLALDNRVTPEQRAARERAMDERESKQGRPLGPVRW